MICCRLQDALCFSTMLSCCGCGRSQSWCGTGRTTFCLPRLNSSCLQPSFKMCLLVKALVSAIWVLALFCQAGGKRGILSPGRGILCWRDESVTGPSAGMLRPLRAASLKSETILGLCRGELVHAENFCISEVSIRAAAAPERREKLGLAQNPVSPSLTSVCIGSEPRWARISRLRELLGHPGHLCPALSSSSRKTKQKKAKQMRSNAAT